MMNVKEYASDVARSVDEILKLCKKLGLKRQKIQNYQKMK